MIPSRRQPIHPIRDILLRLIRMAWQHRARVLGSMVLLLIAKGATVAVPMALKAIVDQLGQVPQLHLPIVLLVGYALLRFSGTLFNELRDLIFARVTQSIVASFARQAFAHLHALGPRYHSRRRSGVLQRDIDRGTSGIAFLLGTALFTLVPTLIEVALVLIIMLRGYAASFAAILLTTFVVYTGFTLLFTARRAIWQRRVNRLDSAAKGQLADSLLNYDNVKLFTGESRELDRFSSVLHRWAEAGVSNQKALFILHVGQSGIIAVGVAAVMLLAGHEVVAGRMTVGDLVLINAFVIQTCLPLNTLGFVYREARDALTNGENLFRLLRAQPEVTDDPDARPLLVPAADVEFDNVDFRYEADRPILHAVSFRIRPGRTVAVVGGSGSGKSTLARLLLRLYDVSAGSIRIDGQDIRRVTAQSLRQAIAVVPQDTLLFNDTIAWNIGYGSPGATREEIVEAARAAHVHDFITSLPEGYETVVGERGVKLSGGERQRLAIARAILKNPPILVFDEATSALDSQSERAIEGELARIARNRTTLIIAHRLSTVASADEILVLQLGRIAERGTHVELLARGGLYAQMWLLQQRESRQGGSPPSPSRAA